MSKWHVEYSDGTTCRVDAERYCIDSGGLYFYKGAPCVAGFAVGQWRSYFLVDPPAETPPSKIYPAGNAINK